MYAISFWYMPDFVYMYQILLTYARFFWHMPDPFDTCQIFFGHILDLDFFSHMPNFNNICTLYIKLFLHRSRFIIFTYARFESHVYLWNLYVKLSLLAAVHNKDDIINSYTSFCYIGWQYNLQKEEHNQQMSMFLTLPP